MKPRRVDVSHLLGIRWRRDGTVPERGLDCRGLAWHGLAACGIDVPAEALAVYPASWSREDCAAALRAYFERTAERWEELGSTAEAATQVGDVVLSGIPGTGLHVSVLVDELPRRLLTTTKGAGSWLLRAGELRDVYKVIRWKPPS